MDNLNDLSKIGVSVSISLFCYDGGEKKILTVINKKQPFKNALTLPNKIMKSNQSLEDVCSEILKENIGNDKIYVEQLNAFGKVYRHPEGRIIDISFYGLINLEKDSVKLNGLAQRIVVRRLDNQKTLAYVALGKSGLHILNVTDIENIIVNQTMATQTMYNLMMKQSKEQRK